MNQPVKAGYFIITRAAEETEGLGACAGQATPPGMLFALRGELGVGKTVFTRGLAKSLLAPEQPAVASPTYVLQQIHRGGRATLYHMDAYRIEGGGAGFEGAGLLESLSDVRGVVCIEWPERVEEVLPEDRVEVEFEHRGSGERIEGGERGVHVMATGPRAAKVVETMIRLAGSRPQLLAYLGKEKPPLFPEQMGPPSLS